ncbi:TetR/AcrR family transcriptional regulator [Pseudonocardia sp. HH130630-07]|uniref:TetR/AcrR family transcriptional regulator n=1 Tax=Pseudonocardia sp. HH130630-07 TaxID=1690815 RepID=UPI000814DCEB|nr:TetR/AcrR family transcriptional regulator [Pseudonocardia sp. HH130630-07]ANY10836.1 hypothetical protein AFB00_31075 [Pseudonocardia sp. HH130630-07]
MGARAENRTVTRTRGPGAAHDQRRGEILAAVGQLAAEHGPLAVSQSAVAAVAGVSPGRVQHYFPSKDEMLTAAFEDLNARSSVRVRERVGCDLSSAVPRAVLEAVLTELIPYDEVTRAHVQFRQAYTALALHHDEVATRLRSRYQHLHCDDLAGLIRRDQETGVIDGGAQPHAIAVRLSALAEGLAYYVLIGIAASETAHDIVLAEIAAIYR